MTTWPAPRPDERRDDVPKPIAHETLDEMIAAVRAATLGGAR